MSEALLATVAAHVAANGGGEGLHETPMPGVHVLCSHHRVMANHALYRPSLCIVVQGAKQLSLGDETIDYGAMQCLVVSMEVPVCGRILDASVDKPFMGVTIDLDMAVLREVLALVDMPSEAPTEPGRSLFVADVDAPLADCVVRLLRLTGTPKAIPVLYSGIMREIYYRLLGGPGGHEIGRLARPGAHMEHVARAMRLIREDLATTVRVERLAQVAGMGLTSFHQHFKTLTAMTPLQFQKHLRLLEARRLMVSEALGVADAAYRVGYESASQFSREYSRMFGVAPKRDTMGARAEAA
jgi:AraC-like DNA-binding protein